MMRHGVYCANFGALGDARTLIDFACAADAAGWDGFFVYDQIVVARGRAVRSVDPWTVLAVVAERTSLTLGPLVTPVARRSPLELAHQSIALDRLSGGRFVLGAGLGEPQDHEALGDIGTARQRGDRLDEGLRLLRRLWSGEAVTHKGSWRLDDVALAPGPVSRIPIWIAGRYGASRPLQRAVRYDGFFPINVTWDLERLLTAAQLAELVQAVAGRRGGLDDFEIVTAGVTPHGQAAAGEIVEAYRAAGATWWLEILEPSRGDPEELLERIAAGPPRVPD